MNTKISFENFNEKSKMYSESRAGYSNNYLNLFCKELSTQNNSYIADIAAGTGINTKQIAKFCNKVYAIEPNKDMMSECILNCQQFSNVEYLYGTSDDTKLPDNSVNIITIAQAFQLLDLQKTKNECQRILNENGKVIIVWNSKENKNDFFYDTEKILLKYCPLYERKLHVLDFMQDTFSSFFSENPIFHKFYDDGVHFITKNEFIGRALCASYSPFRSDKNYNSFVNALENLFDKYSVNNLVYAPLSTVIYIGKV